MKLGRVAAWFLLIFGVWSLVIWPRFMKAIWDDPRSWHDGATSFFLVHALLVAVSLAAGIAIGVIGLRGVRAGQAERAERGERSARADGSERDRSGRAERGERTAGSIEA